MEKYSLCIIFDHRGRTENWKEGPLEVRVTVGRKPYYINSNVRVRRNEWAGAVVNRPDADALNERLGFIVRRVTEEITALQQNGQAIDVQVVKDRLWAKEKSEEKNGLLKWIEEQLPLLGLKPDTLKHYSTLVRRLDEFGKMTAWRDVTVENIYAFNAWLHQLTKPQSMADIQAGVPAVKISDGAVYNYHKTLKALLNRAVKIGRIDSNPYDHLRGEFKRGDKENVEYLTEEEMQAIMSLRPVAGTQMAVARDLFVFQMWTGLGYSDSQKFDISQYKKVDGKWINTGERVKTGVAYIAHLLPPVVEILERYGWQVPKIGNADYNHALKAIQMAAGVTTRLHSHLGRHSFATWMLSNDVPIQNVQRMLGHKDIRQTQRYAKVLAKDVHESFDDVEGRIPSVPSEKPKGTGAERPAGEPAETVAEKPAGEPTGTVENELETEVLRTGRSKKKQ